ncbi:ABC transporter permease subunit [Planococcus sp. MERTA32b]|nr:ABC transporter permease subunit [Planococcus sp. MER TA 32b]
MITRILFPVLVWMLSFTILLLIILLPTDTVFTEGRGGSFGGAVYDYQFTNHWANIKFFFSYIIEQGGLGLDQMGNPISEQIGTVFLRSLKIFLPAILIGFFIGIAKGVIDYRFRKGKGRVIGQFTTAGILAVPDIAVIIVIQLAVLYLQSKGLVDINLFGHDQLDNVLMNILYLSIYPVMFISTITFNALQAEQGEDYVRTARSKGIAEMKVLYTHMLKNGILKIFAYSNTMVLYTLSNLFIVEVFTEYRGAAFYMYDTLGSATTFYVGALLSADVIKQIGYVFLFTVFILVANVVSGIARSFVPVQGEKL